LVPLAVTAFSPENCNAGNVREDPPPDTTLITPATKPEIKRII
jgi:hypothetical protein